MPRRIHLAALFLAAAVAQGCAARNERPAVEPSAIAQPRNTATVALAPPLHPVYPDGKSCPRRAGDIRRFSARVPRTGFDNARFSEALLHATNRVRCERGLAPLRMDKAFSAAARMHSDDMVAHGFISHRSPVHGRTRFPDRMRLARAKFGRSSETIAAANRLAYREGTLLYPRGGQCSFSLTPYGAPLPYRNYGDLAERIVEQWLDSPNHRDSVLDPRFRRAGAGGTVMQRSKICDRVIATQLYSE